MFDHIADYALKNVWCTPGQDNQATFKPSRLSPKTGVWNRFEIMRVVYPLPEQGVRFHVFQLNQINPLILGLTPIDRKWTTFAEACNNETMIADIYTAKGFQFPRTQCWYYVTEDKNVIMAVKEQTLIPADLGVEDMFLRVYRNAYFNSDRADGAYDYIEVVGATVKNIDAIVDLQNQFNIAKTRPGLTVAYVNGYMVPTIDLFSVKPGDCVEYVFDGSVYRVLEFDIAQLSAYTSSLDSKQKFLLHSEQGSDTIDYEDDITFFVYKPGMNNRFKAVLFHRNKEDAIRMVTHCDYGITVPYLEAIAAAQEDWAPIQQLRVRMHVRKSGYKRPLVFEANRIRELYKMRSDEVLKAMVGVDSTVSPWRAEALEASAYCAVMRYRGTDLPKVMVQDCFGYNSLSKLIGDTPLVPYNSSGQQVVAVPYGIQSNATGYEYDADGYLSSINPHIQGSVYAMRDPSAKLVELIGGTGSRRLDEIYGQAATALTAGVDYRFYLCKIASGLPDNKWEDVTGTDKYSIVNNTVLWNIDMERFYPMVRGNRNFLAYSVSLSAARGALRFTLTTEQLRGGTLQERIMEVPMGELDLFLNRRSLIEGLDYVVKFPEIVILNKKYMIDPLNQEQLIDIRFTGFCKPDLTREVCVDKGFIDHALLSNNNRFDLGDDKVQRIIVDGKLYARHELLFAENDSGVSAPNELNGVPYQIRDIVVQMRGLVVDDTYTLREKAKLVDKAVSDYMSTKIPNPTFDTPNAIEQLYPIYSPFFAKVLLELKRGTIDNAEIQQHYNDMDVMRLCKPFEDLLPFDPTQEGQEPNDDYVIIHPHHLNEVIDVDLYQYRFLLRVIKIYLKDKVSINHFVSLSK